MSKEVWVRISTSYAVGGIKLRDGEVIETAPIFRKLMFLSWPRVKKLARRYGWTIQELK